MIDREEALEQIEYLKKLLDETRYRLAGVHQAFLTWGAIWVAGYLGTYLLEERPAAILWAVLIGIGVIGFGIAGQVLGRDAVSPGSNFGRKLGAMNMVLIAVAVAIPPVFLAHWSDHARFAYIPFFVGFIYMVNGVFVGRAMFLPGAWIAAVSLATFAMPLHPAALWMAATGGGGLLVSGFLLRRARETGRR